MATTESAWQPHAARLAEHLVGAGDIHDPAWARAVAETPRHLLVPISYRQRPDGSWEQLDDDYDLAYSPTTLVTALDNGLAMSSSTKPDLMARMLETLDVRDGDRVLEIGTGTGYNAALLAHRLGGDRVYSVDVDAHLVEPARERLASFGVHPHLATRDGATGWAEHGPFDRIIATCSVQRIPWAWAEQLTANGQLLADLKLGAGAGNLVLLRRLGDRLEGRFTGRWAAFMDLRQPEHTDAPGPRQPQASLSRRWTTRAPAQPWNTYREVRMLASLSLPKNLTRGFRLDATTRAPEASMLSALDGSWCEVELSTAQVRGGGPTPLWEQVEEAYIRWRQMGEPCWERFGLTVTPGQHRLWVDSPAHVVAELS
jgi:protein-L-isoaspartate(D-aspartate) O-methyltransferase